MKYILYGYNLSILFQMSRNKTVLRLEVSLNIFKNMANNIYAWKTKLLFEQLNIFVSFICRWVRLWHGSDGKDSCQGYYKLSQITDQVQYRYCLKTEAISFVKNVYFYATAEKNCKIFPPLVVCDRM